MSLHMSFGFWLDYQLVASKQDELGKAAIDLHTLKGRYNPVYAFEFHADSHDDR